MNMQITQQPCHTVQEASQLGFPLDLTRKTLSKGSLTSREETHFRMFVLETAVSQRIQTDKRGLVVRMLEAFQQHFGCGDRFLKKLRSAYIHKS